PFRDFGARRTELANGTKKAEPSDDKGIQVTAQWYIYRLTWPGPRVEPKEMHTLIQEFDRFIGQCTNGKAAPNNRAFVDKLGPALVEACKQVFQHDFLTGDYRLVQVNVASLLPIMAELKQDDISNYLVELVRDQSKHDAIRVYALKGLKEYMPAQPFTINQVE